MWFYFVPTILVFTLEIAYCLQMTTPVSWYKGRESLLEETFGQRKLDPAALRRWWNALQAYYDRARSPQPERRQKGVTRSTFFERDKQTNPVTDGNYWERIWSNMGGKLIAYTEGGDFHAQFNYPWNSDSKPLNVFDEWTMLLINTNRGGVTTPRNEAGMRTTYKGPESRSEDKPPPKRRRLPLQPGGEAFTTDPGHVSFTTPSTLNTQMKAGDSTTEKSSLPTTLTIARRLRDKRIQQRAVDFDQAILKATPFKPHYEDYQNQNAENGETVQIQPDVDDENGHISHIEPNLQYHQEAVGGAMPQTDENHENEANPPGPNPQNEEINWQSNIQPQSDINNNQNHIPPGGIDDIHQQNNVNDENPVSNQQNDDNNINFQPNADKNHNNPYQVAQQVATDQQFGNMNNNEEGDTENIEQVQFPNKNNININKRPINNIHNMNKPVINMNGNINSMSNGQIHQTHKINRLNSNRQKNIQNTQNFNQNGDAADDAIDQANPQIDNNFMNGQIQINDNVGPNEQQNKDINQPDFDPSNRFSNQQQFTTENHNQKLNNSDVEEEYWDVPTRKTKYITKKPKTYPTLTSNRHEVGENMNNGGNNNNKFNQVTEHLDANVQGMNGNNKKDYPILEQIVTRKVKSLRPKGNPNKQESNNFNKHESTVLNKKPTKDKNYYDYENNNNAARNDQENNFEGPQKEQAKDNNGINNNKNGKPQRQNVQKNDYDYNTNKKDRNDNYDDNRGTIPQNDYDDLKSGANAKPKIGSNDYGSPKQEQNDYNTQVKPDDDYGTPKKGQIDKNNNYNDKNDYGRPKNSHNDYENLGSNMKNEKKHVNDYDNQQKGNKDYKNDYAYENDYGGPKNGHNDYKNDYASPNNKHNDDYGVKNDYIAPKHDYVAPKNDYVAPKNDYVAPKNDYVAPKKQKYDDKKERDYDYGKPMKRPSWDTLNEPKPVRNKPSGNQQRPRDDYDRPHPQRDWGRKKDSGFGGGMRTVPFYKKSGVYDRRHDA